MEPAGSVNRCPSCGAAHPPQARFCPDCGHAFTAAEPVSYERAERQVFGVAPPGLLLGLALTTFLGAALLLALAHWLAGGALLIVALALGLFFASAAHQLPEDPAAKGTYRLLVRVRAWARLAAVSAASWARAGRAVLRLRVEQRRLRREQRVRIRALGEAVYREDDTAAASLKAEAHQLADRVEESERELHLALATAIERIGRERATARPTEVVDPRR